MQIAGRDDDDIAVLGEEIGVEGDGVGDLVAVADVMGEALRGLVDLLVDWGVCAADLVAFISANGQVGAAEIRVDGVDASGGIGRAAVCDDGEQCDLSEVGIMVQHGERCGVVAIGFHIGFENDVDRCGLGCGRHDERAEDEEGGLQGVFDGVGQSSLSYWCRPPPLSGVSVSWIGGWIYGRMRLVADGVFY